MEKKIKKTIRHAYLYIHKVNGQYGIYTPNNKLSVQQMMLCTGVLYLLRLKVVDRTLHYMRTSERVE